ncbi:glycosyltransferase family 4 protein [Prosthecochloris sp. SCSIO W1102]|uniref:glycosyltransferase family 4 protein n=1 Tax=Prosthecochloris sp. SCSIO W1102 TaxID=2992243 RepID=UPI00223E112E|nr:glycosyltransferase family 4 protein [Prosthecochloris sp. SCSIO W1102]UZJ39349.1 glycosyltransferase family 4 protein [Prosthecochloris sp. SCSIO W1102]
MQNRKKQGKQLCIFYAAGPGDIVTTFSCWQEGRDDPHQVAVTYSSQFFDLCRTLGAKGVAVSSCPRTDRITTAQFIVENLPKGPASNGIAFHTQQIRYVRKIIERALAVDADLLVMADSTGHLFSLVWLAPKTMRLAVSLHCTLWPRSRDKTARARLTSLLSRRLFANRAQAILCLSNDIRRQLLDMTGGNTVPIYPFIPFYRRKLFTTIQPPTEQRPFNLLYAGRMEIEKGVYDLLEIALMLDRAGIDDVTLHLCGDGSEEDSLRMTARSKGVEQLFHLHGYCHQQEMLEHINRSHAFIVPTRTSFEEGFNKVVAEAILAGRPVITSSVCPALDYVKEAVVEAVPDDPSSYFEAVKKLSSSKDLYREKQQGCKAVQEQFYDPDRSWGAALKKVIGSLPYG